MPSRPGHSGAPPGRKPRSGGVTSCQAIGHRSLRLGHGPGPDPTRTGGPRTTRDEQAVAPSQPAGQLARTRRSHAAVLHRPGHLTGAGPDNSTDQEPGLRGPLAGCALSRPGPATARARRTHALESPPEVPVTRTRLGKPTHGPHDRVYSNTWYNGTLKGYCIRLIPPLEILSRPRPASAGPGGPRAARTLPRAGTRTKPGASDATPKLYVPSSARAAT